MHPPTGIEVLKMKAVEETENQVEFLRTTINLDWLATFTDRVNQLNTNLAQLAAALTPLQGPLPSDIRIF